VSVRTERDAGIVACERQDPFSSPCYWIILGGWASSGYKSVIRRCPERVNTDRDKTEICSQPAEAKKVSMNIKFELVQCVQPMRTRDLQRRAGGTFLRDYCVLPP
jgi:hypothetical protein